MEINQRIAHITETCTRNTHHIHTQRICTHSVGSRHAKRKLHSLRGPTTAAASARTKQSVGGVTHNYSPFIINHIIAEGRGEGRGGIAHDAARLATYACSQSLLSCVMEKLDQMEETLSYRS